MQCLECLSPYPIGYKPVDLIHKIKIICLFEQYSSRLLTVLFSIYAHPEQIKSSFPDIYTR